MHPVEYGSTSRISDWDGFKLIFYFSLCFNNTKHFFLMIDDKMIWQRWKEQVSGVLYLLPSVVSYGVDENPKPTYMRKLTHLNAFDYSPTEMEVV